MAGKVSKASVRYGVPRKANQRCGNCTMYRPGKDERRGHCTLVEGVIEAHMWCERWAAKK